MIVKSQEAQGFVKQERMDVGNTNQQEERDRPSGDGRLLRVSAVAAILGVHSNTVRIWTELGVLKCYRIGPRRDRRIPQSSVNDLLISIK